MPHAQRLVNQSASARDKRPSLDGLSVALLMAGDFGNPFFATDVFASSIMVGPAVPDSSLLELQPDGTRAAPTLRRSSAPGQSSSASTYDLPVPTAASWPVLQLSWRWHDPHTDRFSAPTTSTTSSTSAPCAPRPRRYNAVYSSLATRSFFPAPFNLMTSFSTKRKSVACNYTVIFNPLSGLAGSDSQEQLF